MSAGHPDADTIRSARHPLAVRIRKIVARPQLARRQGIFLLDGTHLLEEALSSTFRPEQILVATGYADSAAGRRLLASIHSRGWPVVLISDPLMERLAPTETPQGILGLFHCQAGPPAATLPRRARTGATPWSPIPLALLLAGLQDPGNIGALARTARALGCAALITTPRTGDPFHVRALRASAGALLHLPVARAVAPADLLAWRDQEEVTLIATVPHGGRLLAEVLPAAESRGPLALVLGSEGRGLPAAIADLCQVQGRIPTRPDVDSLGVAAAGAIALYEAATRLG